MFDNMLIDFDCKYDKIGPNKGFRLFVYFFATYCLCFDHWMILFEHVRNPTLSGARVRLG